MISLTCHTCHTACPLNSLMRNSFFRERADVRLCYPLLRGWCMGSTEQVCKFIYCKWRFLTGVLTGIDCYGNTHFVTARHRGGITDTMCHIPNERHKHALLLSRTLQDQQAKIKMQSKSKEMTIYRKILKVSLNGGIILMTILDLRHWARKKTLKNHKSRLKNVKLNLH